jgi:hypothetical protein
VPLGYPAGCNQGRCMPEDVPSALQVNHTQQGQVEQQLGPGGRWVLDLARLMDHQTCEVLATCPAAAYTTTPFSAVASAGERPHCRSSSSSVWRCIQGGTPNLSSCCPTPAAPGQHCITYLPRSRMTPAPGRSEKRSGSRTLLARPSSLTFSATSRADASEMGSYAGSANTELSVTHLE